MSLLFCADSLHPSDAVAGFLIGAVIAAFIFYHVHTSEDEDVPDVGSPHQATQQPNEGWADREPSARVNGGAASDAPAATGGVEQEVQMRDMYAAAEIVKAGKRNPFG